MRAGIYARISLDAEGQGLGVQRQIEDCTKLAEAKGWTVTETYTDNDVSAFKGKARPEYQRMLADVEGGRIDALVVYDLDRLTRRLGELVAFMDLMEAKSVPLANVAGDVDLSSDQGRFMASIKGAVAEQEARRTGQRIKRQKEQRSSAGLKQGGRYRVYGYTRAYKVVPEEAAVVREAFTRRAAGESATAISADLTERGLLTVAGKPWSANSLIKLLSKTEYAGLLTSNGQVVGPTAYDAIVDEALFNAAQKEVLGAARGTNARVHLLSGVLVCHRCLNTMKGNSANGRPSYRCPSPKGTVGACGSCSIQSGPTDENVFNAAWRKWQDAPVDKAEPVRDYQAEIDAIDAEILEGQEGAKSGAVLMRDVMPILKGLRARRAVLAKEQAIAVGVDLGVLQPMVDWEDKNLSQKRLWITGIIDYVVVGPSTHGARYGFDPERLTVHYKDGTVERLTKGKVLDRSEGLI